MVGKKSILRKRFALVSAAIASAVFASLAHAGSYSMAVGDSLSLSATGVNGYTGYTGNNPTWTLNTPQVTVNYSKIGPGNTSATGEKDYAGQIDWSGSDTTQNETGLNFLTYCVQLTTLIYVPSGATAYTVSDLANTMDVGDQTSSTKAAEIAALIANNPTQLYAAAPNTSPTSAAAQGYLAFQVAIWDLVYNGGTLNNDIIKTGNSYSFNVLAGTAFNVASGQSSIVTAADADLNSILNTSTGALNTSSVAYNSATHGYLIDYGGDIGQTIYGLTSDAGTQNQSVLAMSVNPGALGTITPLPGTCEAVLSLLGGSLGVSFGLTKLSSSRRKQIV